MSAVGVNDASKSGSLIKVFSSPSTLPHLLSLGGFSGFLYVAMKIDLFGSEIQGSIIFLSLSVSYFFAALISPSRIGKWIFTVQHGGDGILNRNYWFGGFSRLIPIIAVAGTFWLISNLLFVEGQLSNARIFLALLFIGMSVFQGVSLAYGWVVYARKVQRSPRKSRIGGVFSFVRSLVAVIVFLPLVWWFGYGAGNPSNASYTDNTYWILFLIIIALIGVLLDRYTKGVRDRDGVDGAALDRAFFFIFITSCWHLLGAWRRSPIATEQSSAGMLLEEAVLMSISIILAVWSMAKRGERRGWRIFQGQSAVFWGIGFGFIYAGSITSLTALSEGSLLTTTAIGHAITALVMMGILPMCISWIGQPDIEKIGVVNQPQSAEERNNSEHLPGVGKLTQEPTIMDDDVVELLD
ncbi:MAG: hypothetical protein QGI73_05410 [Candidatus Thalassarchaeaceae archaeon]|nr:hypothetical protein [Candidatus Thalassarchaeaceae archaeon]